MSAANRRRLLRWAWDISALLALLAIPTLLVLETPIWQERGWNFWVVAAMAASYVLGTAAMRWGGPLVGRAPAAVGTALIAFAGVAGVCGAVALHLSADYSRAVLVWSVALLLFGLGGHALAAWFRLGYAASVLAALLVLAPLGALYEAVRTEAVGLSAPTRSTRTISASQHILTTTIFSGYFPAHSGPPRFGGAVTADPAGEGYLFARASGEIYRLRWGADGDLRVADTGARAPLNFAEFAADEKVTTVGHFRVADLLARKEGEATRIYISHHYWYRDRQCFVVRVSTTILPPAGSPGDASGAKWQTLFETQPCLKVFASRGVPFAGMQVGGNLEFLDDRHILLTVGDHQFDGWYRPINLVRDPKAHYGKTVLIDVGTGHWSIFTIGHRNPEGLTVDLQGRVWSTEHGPRGGDELNLLRKGHDYGYPMHTYGTEYGSTVWPGADEAVKNPALTRPVYAWVPSIGPSDLIVVSDPAFYRWRGDLLVASLRGMAIWRVRLDGEHVAYAEPIPIGRRIRDIAAGKGEFVLLTDSDEIVRIRSDDHADEGGLIFMLRCGGCHDNLDHRIGPNLLGVMGHQIASRKGYHYSAALKHVRGSWTRERLDQFLKDPQAFAPGTAMTIDGVQDPVERRRIIDYIVYFYED